MKLTKKQRTSGITLVALVVTIVVLLILAGITIATLFGENGVINKAQKAKEETDRVAIEEQEGINKTEEDMKNAIEGNTLQESGWRQPDPLKNEITNGETTLKIGDYVDYSCKSSTATYTSLASKSGHTKDQIFRASAYNYGWRVLGIDKKTKQLQLISEEFVPLTGGGDRENRKGQYYYLKGQSGYTNGVEELNKICAIYGTGIGATSARIVNVDDINWITGYNPNNVGVKDPNKTGSGIKCDTNQIDEYGNTVKYTFTGTNVKYEPTNGVESGTRNYKQFTYYDSSVTNENPWKSLVANESVMLSCSRYLYYPTTLTVKNDTSATTGILRTSQEYKMLFANSSTGADVSQNGSESNIYYWLGSRSIHTGPGYVYFGLRIVRCGDVYYDYFYNSGGEIHNPYLGVRPVVNLDSKVTLKDSGTMKDGCKLYNMSVK